MKAEESKQEQEIECSNSKCSLKTFRPVLSLSFMGGKVVTCPVCGKKYNNFDKKSIININRDNFLYKHNGIIPIVTNSQN